MANIREYLKIAEESPADFSNFKEYIFKHTLKWEGGGKLHNVPGDSGGWTIWGIAYNYNKEVFKNFDDFKDTTYEEAAAVAYIRYYKSACADLVPVASRLMYFDMAYNLGVSRAIKIMQKCAGVTADGIIGPMTKKAMAKVCEGCLYNERNSFYNLLVKNNNSLSKFLKGWLNRSKAIFDVD